MPDTSKIRDRDWNRRFDRGPGWNLRVKEQIDLLKRLSKWGEETRETPSAMTDPNSYSWNNSAFNATDAMLYHAMIREFRPQNIVELVPASRRSLPQELPE